jgi:hypothetical protein
MLDTHICDAVALIQSHSLPHPHALLPPNVIIIIIVIIIIEILFSMLSQ